VALRAARPDVHVGRVTHPWHQSSTLAAYRLPPARLPCHPPPATVPGAAMLWSSLMISRGAYATVFGQTTGVPNSLNHGGPETGPAGAPFERHPPGR